MSDDLLRSPLFRGILGDAYREQIPLSVHAELTNACNQRCGHCYIDRNRTETLSLKEWESLLDQLVRLRTLVLTLSGGEPLLHPEFASIYEAAAARRFGIRLFTNGLLLDGPVLKLLEARPPLDVEISLYGHTPEIHDGITGVGGSFEKTIAAVKKVAAGNIPVRLKCVWMKPNFRFFRDLKDFARSLGAELLGTTILTGSRDEHSRNLDFRLDSDELKDIMKEGERESAVRTSDEMRGEPPTMKKSDIFCGAGFVAMRIAADGKVFPCVEYELEAGDSLTTSLGEIWRRSPLLVYLRRLRKKDAAICSSCELEDDCFRCPAQALKEGGDILGCYPEAHRHAQIRKSLREEKDERNV